MTYRLLKAGLCLTTAFMAAGGFFAGRLQAADAKPEPVAPPANSSTVNGNTQKPGDKKDGLKDIEDDLFKPMKKTFSPKGSLEGVLITPPQTRTSTRSIPQTKKEKELEEERKEWVFMSPDEMASGPTIEEIFNVPEYGPDGLEKKKLSPMERFIEGMERRSNGETNSNRGNDSSRFTGRNQSSPKREVVQADESKQPKKSDDDIDRLEKLFSAKREKGGLLGAENHGTVSDIFGLGDSKITPEWSKAQKVRMDEFKQLIGFSSTSPAFGSDPFGAAHGLGDASPKPASPVSAGDASSSFKMSWDSPFEKGAAAPLASGLPDFNSKPFGQSSFTPAPARTEPFNAPPLPNFNTPKRPF